MSVTQRLTELGINWPAVATPVGSYVPATRVGDLIYTSGQTSMVDGVPQYLGTLGDDLTIEQGQAAARQCALNALAAAAGAVGGVDNIGRIVKLTVFVASAPGFHQQPTVANGASDLCISLFGDDGRHARSAIGVSALPLGCAVEVELIAQVAA